MSYHSGFIFRSDVVEYLCVSIVHNQQKGGAALIEVCAFYVDGKERFLERERSRGDGWNKVGTEWNRSISRKGAVC